MWCDVYVCVWEFVGEVGFGLRILDCIFKIWVVCKGWNYDFEEWSFYFEVFVF